MNYDPHPQDHDDARSTPSGFTTGPSAAQKHGSTLPLKAWIDIEKETDDAN